MEKRHRWMVWLPLAALAGVAMFTRVACGPQEEPLEKNYYTGPFHRPGSPGYRDARAPANKGAHEAAARNGKGGRE